MYTCVDVVVLSNTWLIKSIFETSIQETITSGVFQSFACTQQSKQRTFFLPTRTKQMMIMMVCFEKIFSEFSGFKYHAYSIFDIYTCLPKNREKWVKPLKKSNNGFFRDGLQNGWSRIQGTFAVSKSRNPTPPGSIWFLHVTPLMPNDGPMRNPIKNQSTSNKTQPLCS